MKDRLLAWLATLLPMTGLARAQGSIVGLEPLAIGLTLTVGAAVFGLLKMGVSARFDPKRRKGWDILQ